MNKQELMNLVLTLKDQISEAEKMDDSVLKEVTLYSLNRQMTQIANQLTACSGTLVRAKKKASIHKRMKTINDQKKTDDLNREEYSSFHAEHSCIKQIG